MDTVKRTESLVFEIDDIRCAVEVACVVEVVRAVSVKSVPGQPQFIAGVIDVRGKLLPVLNLRARVGRATREVALSDHFIIVAAPTRSGRTIELALWVDAVVDVIAFDAEDLVEAEGLIVGQRSLAGIVRTAQGLVMIHDPEAFFTESESDALALAGLGI